MKFFNVLTALILLSVTATASQYQLKNCKESAKIDTSKEGGRLHSSAVAIYPILENGDVLELSGTVNALPLSLSIGNKLSVKIEKQFDEKSRSVDFIRYRSISKAQLKDNGKKLVLERSEFTESGLSSLFGVRGNEQGQQIEMTETKLKWKKIHHATWPNGSMTYSCELTKLN